MTIKGVPVALAALVLAACTARDVTVPASDSRFDGPSTAEVTRTLETVDWSRMTTVALRVRQNAFQPLILTFQRGMPYALRVENGDKRVHSFMAEEFLAGVAVQALVPDTGTTVGPRQRLAGIVVPPGETRTLTFVPLADGYYRFHDGLSGGLVDAFLVAPLNGFGTGSEGMVRVEPTRR